MVVFYKVCERASSVAHKTGVSVNNVWSRVSKTTNTNNILHKMWQLTYVLVLDHCGNKLLLKLGELRISDISDCSLCCILKLTITVSCHHLHFKLSAKYKKTTWSTTVTHWLTIDRYYSAEKAVTLTFEPIIFKMSSELCGPVNE